MTFAPAGTQSAYLQPELDFPEDNKLFREILSDRERRTAEIINVKENAQFEKRELLTAKQYFSAVQSGAIQTTYSFRLTFDLVALNGGVAIPNGATTTLSLSTSTQPALINIPTALFPLEGYGAADNGTNFFFINDPLVYVRTNEWTNASQQILITNNSGATLTWCVWVFEYKKT